MVISDGTGRSYGRPPGGSLVEGSRNRSRVSRRFSRVSRRVSRLFANANCIGGVRFERFAKGGRTSMEGGRFEVCSAVACKAAKPTTALQREFRGCDEPRRNGGVCSDASKRWWVPPPRMRRRCVALSLQLIQKPEIESLRRTYRGYRSPKCDRGVPRLVESGSRCKALCPCRPHR